MPSLPHRHWRDMSTKDFAALGEPERVTAVLPVGAVEQHGPHLPLSVDADIAAGVLDAALRLIPDDLPVLVLPMLPVGFSPEHEAFAGTLSLSASTLAALWTDVALGVRRAGLRKLVFLNGHGGNPPVMDVVARDLRARHDMLVVTCSWFDLGLPPGLFDASETTHGIHGGAVETSAMLHLRPDVVRRAECRDFASIGLEMAAEFRHLSPQGRIGFAWQAQDLNLFGVCGDAASADAQKGRAVVEHAAREFAALLREVDRFPLDALKGRV